MTYELGFLELALNEWHKLDSNTCDQFKAKLTQGLAEPRLPSAKLSGSKDQYKIKLKSAGYRLIYEVRNRQLLVVVVAVGKRDRNAVYRVAGLVQFAHVAVEGTKLKAKPSEQER